MENWHGKGVRIWLMSLCFLFLTFLTQDVVSDNTSGFEFNAVTAEKYAQGALIECFKNPPRPTEVDAAIKTKPIILSGINKEGRKLVLVLYRKNSGAFAVGLFINKDGFLEIDSRAETKQSIEELKDQFNIEPFTWGGMEGDE